MINSNHSAATPAYTPSPMWHAVSDPLPVTGLSGLPLTDESTVIADDPLKRQAGTDPVSASPDGWSASLCTVVRNYPLVSLAAAMAAGALIARIARPTR